MWPAALGREVCSSLRVVYLTARPLRHLADSKRFIAGVMERQQVLPAGPLFCNKVGQFCAACFCLHACVSACLHTC